MAFATAAPAWGQAAREVPIGGTALLERSAQPISGAKTTRGAVLSGADGANLLVYVAPDRVTDGQAATVTYTLGTEPRTVVITLRETAPSLTDPRFYTASFKALFSLFVLAILVESGLALLFRWQPYLAIFNGRGTNVLVAFVFSYLIVSAFHLDITTALMNVYTNKDYPPGLTGYVLTALIVAGGSSGVRRILQSLGFRAPPAVEAAPVAPPANEAWISVTLVRDKAVGPVAVQIGVPGAVAIAGTINGTSRHSGFLRFFLRDRGRFPESGGYRVVPGQYEVRVQGMGRGGAALDDIVWGPAAIGGRAIVDLQFKL